jgi:hypothetical protein
MEEGCRSWCEAMLYIVPAKVDGSWQLPQGRLELAQEFQTVNGTLTSNGETLKIENGTVKVNEITFTAGQATYTGRVKGDTITGTVKTGGREQRFTAKR